MNSQYGWASSAHQNPIGQPVCCEIAGFDTTISTRLGRSGAKTSTVALIEESSLFVLRQVPGTNGRAASWRRSPTRNYRPRIDQRRHAINVELLHADIERLNDRPPGRDDGRQAHAPGRSHGRPCAGVLLPAGAPPTGGPVPAS